MKKLTVSCCAILSVCFVSAYDKLPYVDPSIGSGGHGHVFVGANVPHGMVQLGPVNITEGWDWCSGYHVSDTTVIGFAHTHLSGTGIGDKGDVQIMPVVGTPKFHDKREFLSPFQKKNEKMEAGYYRTVLDKYGITAELTASDRVGFHRYTYPAGYVPQLILNLKQGIGWDWPTNCTIELMGDSLIVGQRLSTGWAADDRLYYALRFSAPIQELEIRNDTTRSNNGTVTITKDAYALITFSPTSHIIEAQVGISGVDIYGALKNLKAEGSDTFNTAQQKTQKKWGDYLSRIEVTGATIQQLRTLYTALYHTAFFPSLFSDTDGRYRGADGKVHYSPKPIFTTFSLWDTYRALAPLYTLTEPENVAIYVNSLLDINDRQGRLPVWHLSGNETDCMVGVGSVQVIADAVLKGVAGVDPRRAYRAIRSYADRSERGLDLVREMGFIPADKEGESVAKALEYCISDAAVAAVAQKLGLTKDYNHFSARAEAYKQYFDTLDMFPKGLFEDGSRRTPFDPASSTHREDDFCEGNAWQYSWMVPHDIAGLIALHRTPEDAERRLDSLFLVPFDSKASGSPDISGMIGQYAHGNEPSHSTIYAYGDMGRPDKMVKMQHTILDSLYDDTPAGLAGNEDCGQMSAWYVLNAIGLYQPNPAAPEFTILTPLFPEVKIALPNNRSFTIKSSIKPGLYPQSIKLNGRPYKRATLTYSSIIKGGVLELD